MTRMFTAVISPGLAVALSFILVNPKTAKPPFAGVIFQHGGGKSMWNYLSEALILAQLGVVSRYSRRASPRRG